MTAIVIGEFEPVVKHPGHPDQKVHGRRGRTDPGEALAAVPNAVDSVAKRDIVNEYVGGNGHVTINEYLRTGQVDEWRRDTVDGQIRALDGLIDGPRTTAPITVYRGVRGPVRAGTFTDRGYLSTSADPHVAEDVFGGAGANAFLALRLPAGSRALSTVGSEREVLLPRGTTFRIDKVTTVGGRDWAEGVVL